MYVYIIMYYKIMQNVNNNSKKCSEDDHCVHKFNLKLYLKLIDYFFHNFHQNLTHLLIPAKSVKRTFQ